MIKGKFPLAKEVQHAAHEDIRIGKSVRPVGDDPRSPCHSGVRPKIPDGFLFFFFLWKLPL